jgi:hypothetical protein
MENFGDNIDKVLNGTYPEDDIVPVSENTPALLRELGFADLPICITQKHIKNILRAPDGSAEHYHGLSKDLLIYIIKQIEVPAFVLKSYRNTDRVIVVPGGIDFAGNPIVTILQNKGKAQLRGKHIRTNIVNSMYGKENFNRFLSNALAHDELMYCDKEKSRNLSVMVGLQLPKQPTNYDFNNIIRDINGNFKHLEQKNQEKGQEKSRNSPVRPENSYFDPIANYDFNNIIRDTNGNVKHLEQKNQEHKKSRNLPGRVGNSYSKSLTNYDFNNIIRDTNGNVKSPEQENSKKDLAFELSVEKLMELGMSRELAEMRAARLVPVAKYNLAKAELAATAGGAKDARKDNAAQGAVYKTPSKDGDNK